ncbi:hypothetical protein, partial [Streptomyces griseus]|uniref:hypothetical protein n=1 Tax=Streptomyces griseus TaxID=1911 RepID=UPI00374E12C4
IGVRQLAAMPGLRELGLSNCPRIRTIEPLARTGLEWLSLVQLHPELDPAPRRPARPPLSGAGPPLPHGERR